MPACTRLTTVNAEACYEGRFVVKTLAGTGEKGYCNGAKRDAQFCDLSSVAVDKDDNVYVLDDGNKCVRKISRAGLVTTLMGMNDPDARAGIPKVNPLGGIAVAASGDMFFVPDLFCIQIVTPSTGTLSTLAGTRDVHGFRDGPGNQALFGYFSDLVLDHKGKTLIVSDCGNYCIRGVSIEHGYVWTIAGAGSAGAANGPSRVAQFREPGGVALCANGDIVVVDRRINQIRRINGRTREVSTVAGTGQPGWRDGDVLRAEFNFPCAVAIDNAGRLYVADAFNNCIRRIDLTSGRVVTIAGSGEGGWRDGSGASAAFRCVVGIGIGQNGVLYVGDTHNNVIRSITEVAEVAVSVDILEGILNQDAVAPEIKAELRSILDDGKTMDDIAAQYRAAEEARTTCKVCFERPVEALFVPCGHFVCCERCANEVHECPVCRVRVSDRHRVCGA